MTKESLEAVLAEMNELYTPEGAERPIVFSGENRPQEEFIPCVSPALGFALGTGGWIKGKLHEAFGREGTGKTSLAFLFLKDVYEYHEGKRAIAYIDLEHRYNESWAKQLGVPTDDMIVVQPPSAESATDFMAKLIEPSKKNPGSKGVCAVAFDSIGAAMSWKEHQTFQEQVNRVGGVASVMTRNVKMMAPLANIYGSTVMYLNQLRADMEGYNRPITPGGYAVKYHMSVRLYLRQGRDKWMDKIDGQELQVGIPIIFKVVKNSWAVPNREGWSNFYFIPSKWYDGIGFDVEQDVQQLGLLTGIIERKGSYYEYGGIKEQGRLAFFEALKGAGLYDDLLQEVNSKLTTKRSSMTFEEMERPAPADDIEIEEPEV